MSATEAIKLMETRGHLSLASQVIYQCRVFQLLRERPQEAGRLLLDPIELAAVYREAYEHAAD